MSAMTRGTSLEGGYGGYFTVNEALFVFITNRDAQSAESRFDGELERAEGWAPSSEMSVWSSFQKEWK